MSKEWMKAGKRVQARQAVQESVAASLLDSYKTKKKSPREHYDALVRNNTTHFNAEELKRLLSSFCRATSDKLNAAHFYELVREEIGWRSLLLQKQLFKAFDLDEAGEINFTEFAEGYSTMLRGTVPELLAFSFRLYNIQGTRDELLLADLYTVLRIALSGVDDLRGKQGISVGSADDSRFPDQIARQMIESIFGDSEAPISRNDFNELILRQRKFVEHLIPGFELIPQDPLHKAAEAGETRECLHLLTVDKLNVDGRDGGQFPTTPLHMAAQYGHVEVVAVLLNADASTAITNKEGETALGLAVKHGRTDVVKLLLDKGADPVISDDYGKTPIHIACTYSRQQILPLLLAHGEDVMLKQDSRGRSVLHAAAEVDGWQSINVLIEHGKIDPSDMDQILEMKDNDGRTPLAIASQVGAIRTASMLLTELGAQINVIDKTGMTCLHIAVAGTYGDSEVGEIAFRDASGMVKLLLSEGIDVDSIDYAGRTAIYLAAQQAEKTRDIKVIRALCDNTANVNMKDIATGMTALHHAVLGNWIDCVQTLLSATPACEVVRDSNGLTAIDFARSADVFKMLNDYVSVKYPQYDKNHPIEYLFGIIFFDGSWELQREGDMAGQRMLKLPRVTREIRDARVAMNMKDKEQIISAFSRAGLLMFEETILMRQRGLSGLIEGDIKQYSFLRVSAPLYRLQKEAMKMRLQVKRLDVDNYEDFCIDEELYPRSSFVPLTLGEKQTILLNIIESRSQSDNLAGVENLIFSKDYDCAGILISQYIELGIIKTLLVLHDPRKVGDILEKWNLSRLGSVSTWREQFQELLATGHKDDKHPEFRNLYSIIEYYGHKYGFYFGFFSYYTNWLLAPAIIGFLAFGLTYIDSRYESVIDDPTDETFDDRYDHPFMFAYALFLAFWASTLMKGWSIKSKELAFRWGVSDQDTKQPLRNPYSIATVGLAKLNGLWQWTAELNDSQKRAQRLFQMVITIPGILVLLAMVGGHVYGAHYFLDEFRSDCSYFKNCNFYGEKLNFEGNMYKYGIFVCQAFVINVVNNFAISFGQWSVERENHETIDIQDNHLSIRALAVMIPNSFAPLFYLGYYEKDLDLTAEMLATLMIVGQVFNNFFEYFVPWFLLQLGKNLDVEKRGLVKQNDVKTTKLIGAEEGLKKLDAVSAASAAAAMAEAASKKAPEKGSITQARKRLASIQEFTKMGSSADSVDAVSTVGSAARDELRRHHSSSALELADTVIQYGYIIMFGAVWPLAAALVFLNNVFELRLDMWKLCKILRRGFFERVGRLSQIWIIAFEVMTVLGIVNHCFLLCYSSNSMKEYFFPSITEKSRLLIAFVAQNVLLTMYAVTRLYRLNREPKWISERRGEPLRYVRDAYRVGIVIREKRFQQMSTNPEESSLRIVCDHFDIDLQAAERYLLLVRYLSTLSVSERRQHLLDTDNTIGSLVSNIMLMVRTGRWVDPLEPPSAELLFSDLVPVTDLHESYDIGKRYREEVYKLWDRNQHARLQATSVEESIKKTRLALRQFACIALDITLPQAMRYTQLVRYVESGLAVADVTNNYEILETLKAKYPGGLLEVLEVVNRTYGDNDQLLPDEPDPESLGPYVETEDLAVRAEKLGAKLRRQMYESWFMNNSLKEEELIKAASLKTGLHTMQILRYLEISRFLNDLDEQERQVAKQNYRHTLEMTSFIATRKRRGMWRDRGERTHDYVSGYAPPVVEEEEEGIQSES